jgi:hypothetical protein
LPAGNFFCPAPASIGFIYSEQGVHGLSGRFSREGNREIGGPEQGNSAAEQGTKAAHQRAFPGVYQGAVYNAIAAIFAPFTPEGRAMMTGPGPGQ